MEPWFQMVATIVCAVVASSGFLGIHPEEKREKRCENTDVDWACS